MKLFFRRIMFPFLLWARLDKLILFLRKKRCILVNFHGVVKDKTGQFNNRHLLESEFEKILLYFKNNFEIVTLNELFNIHRGNKKQSKKTICLTFDDGYLNNFEVALPLLKKHKIPATFYIISAGLSENNFYVWPDIIDLVQKYSKGDLEFSFGKFKRPFYFSEDLNCNLVDFIKKSGDNREAFLNEIKENCSFYKEKAELYPTFTKLVTKELLFKHKDEELIEYGSHTHLHYNLEYLSEGLCQSELNESKKVIEDSIGKKIDSLAFPDGSYNRTTLEQAKKANYTNVVAVEYKLNENNSDPFILSRFTISNSTTFESNILRLARDFDKYGF
ncbi:MAG: polysaccharide deacetylase family protein [Bacteroidia bacterium]